MRNAARSRRKKHHFPLITILLIFVITAAGVFLCMETLNDTHASASVSKASISKIKSNKLYSQNVILIDADSGKVLFGKDEEERCYPASLTKILTAFTAIQNAESLSDEIRMDGQMIDVLRAKNASMAGYLSGEMTTVNDLLYGSLLASGADASWGLATATAGSTGSFARLLNDEAEKLGATNTNFTNSTGLQDDNHYTTAKDMSEILMAALENSTFREIFTTKSHNIRTDSREFTVESSFFSNYLGGDGSYTVEGAKTGTTSDAGACLASLVKKGGKEYILVTMGAPIGGSSQPFSYEDLDYIFTTI